MQLCDPTLLISIIGLPAKHLKSALRQEIDVYKVATSREGLLYIKKYWDAHCSTLPKLPAIALLDNNSCPRGISDNDFVSLLSRLTDLQQWQIWDLWGVLDIHSSGFVGCPEFTLMVVLICAAISQQQMQALHAYQSSICKVFAGAHVGNTLFGLNQCCLLLDLPCACLVAALRQLQMEPALLDEAASNSSSAKPDSSNCCSNRACSYKRIAGSAAAGSACEAAAQCTKHAWPCSCGAVGAGKCSSGLYSGAISFRKGCIYCAPYDSSSVIGPSLTASSSRDNSTFCIAGVATAAAAQQHHARCPCCISADKDVQLLLYCTIQHAQRVNLEWPSSSRSGNSSRSSRRSSSIRLWDSKKAFVTCVGCIVS